MNENERRGFIITAMLVILAIGVCFVMIPEMGKRPRTQPYRKLIRATLPITDPQKPYSYGSMKKDLKNIREDFFGRIKLSIIGRSLLKRDIFLVKLGKGPRKAIANLIRKEKYRLFVVYNSPGNMVFWKNGQSGPEQRRDLTIARAMSEITGHRITYKERGNGYGGLKDWYNHQFKKSVITIEQESALNERLPELTIEFEKDRL